MFVEHKEVGEVKELDAVSNLLLKAAALIEKHGWCQNRLEDQQGRMCLRGAIGMAAAGNAHFFHGGEWVGVAKEADQRVHNAISGGKAWECPGMWNNERGRTQEEVVAKLRAVALGG